MEMYELSLVSLVVEWSLASCCKSVWLGSIPVHHMNHFGLGQGYELVID